MTGREEMRALIALVQEQFPGQAVGVTDYLQAGGYSQSTVYVHRNIGRGVERTISGETLVEVEAKVRAGEWESCQETAGDAL